MGADIRERLINLVRQHQCLFNPMHEQYKNKNYKSKLWMRIGAALGVDENKAKESWRTLRDGYVRYRKQKCDKTSSGRKYSHYTWSAQMAFLDASIRAPRTSKILQQEVRSESPEAVNSHISPIPQLTVTPKVEVVYDEMPLEQETLDSVSGTFQQEYTLPMHSDAQSSTSSEENDCKPKKRRMSMTKTEALDYFRNNDNKSPDFDDVDHLFTSYAKTFKRLSLRNQAELKMNLARVFAEAELRDGGYRID